MVGFNSGMVIRVNCLKWYLHRQCSLPHRLNNQYSAIQQDKIPYCSRSIARSTQLQLQSVLPMHSGTNLLVANPIAAITLLTRPSCANKDLKIIEYDTSDVAHGKENQCTENTFSFNLWIIQKLSKTQVPKST